jgi:hypothetical protein
MRCRHPKRKAWRRECIWKVRDDCSSHNNNISAPRQVSYSTKHGWGEKISCLGALCKNGVVCKGCTPRTTESDRTISILVHSTQAMVRRHGYSFMGLPQWYILWQERNQDLHGRDVQQQQSNLRQTVTRQLRVVGISML